MDYIKIHYLFTMCYYFNLFISAYNFTFDKAYILRQENVLFW